MLGLATVSATVATTAHSAPAHTPSQWQTRASTSAISQMRRLSASWVSWRRILMRPETIQEPPTAHTALVAMSS